MVVLITFVGPYGHPISFVINDWKSALEILGDLWLDPCYSGYRWFVQTGIRLGVRR
jgi:hypothetical protein